MVALSGLALFGCAVDADAESEPSVQVASPLDNAPQTDRTGDDCMFFLCHSGLARNGKCTDARCSECMSSDGRRGPEDGNEVCGPIIMGFYAPKSPTYTSSSGGVVRTP